MSTATVSPQAPARPAFGSRQLWTALAATALLFVPGIASFGPVFDGLDGYLAAGGGVALGLLVSVASRLRRWPAMTQVALLLGAYLLFGGAFALRKTTIAGVIPTPDTLVRLAPLSVQAWRDLLTVTPPANEFIGPAVVPYLAGLVTAAVAGNLALRRRGYLAAAIPALVLWAVGIAWGTHEAASPVAWAAFFAAVFLGWATLRRGRDDVDAAVGVSGAGDRSTRWPGLAMIAGAAALSLLAAPLLGASLPRYVARDYVRPPLNLADYPSPLTAYRALEIDQKDVGLFTIGGVPAGGRVRLATMDAYDGHVYNVADSSASFVRVGQRIGTGRPANPSTLDVEVGQYTGVWMPGSGEVRGVRFDGPSARAQADSLYYNSYTGTLLTTAGVGQGTRYAVDLESWPSAADLPADAQIADASTPENQRVPDAIEDAANTMTDGAGTQLEQLRTIEKTLHTTGYYSNGSDGRSRAGHSLERIAGMLSAPQLVGDDEQYAVAMALMARHLGIPARVVMGFYPDPKQPAADKLTVTGTMAHVWVEVPFKDHGWVSFDPTPDRDRVPQTVVPKPKPQPKPQVLPPPDPPLNRPPDPLDDAGRERDQSQDPGDDLLTKVLWGLGIGLGVTALISTPFIAIAIAKRRRRAAREFATEASQRSAGAWDELVDYAVDRGTKIPVGLTRREGAPLVTADHPQVDAYKVALGSDAGVFGPRQPSTQRVEALWAEVDAALVAMRSSAGRWGRFRAFCSLRSFRRNRRAERRVRRPRRKE